MASREARSRSPPGAASLALQPRAPPQRCSFTDETLVLDGRQLPFIRYALGAKDEIWFPAKPVMTVTGETTITQSLARVPDDCKMSFKDLAAAKGLPADGCCGFRQPPNPDNHNEGKAIWVNESGFYAMLLGSRKPQCVTFQRWVLQEVLPSIRRSGAYVCPESCSSMESMAAVKHACEETAPQPLTGPKQLLSQKRTGASGGVPRALLDSPSGAVFMNLVKERCPAGDARALKATTRTAYAEFLRLVAQDEQSREASVAAELHSSFGLCAVVPEKWRALATAAVEAAMAPKGNAARGPAAPPAAPARTKPERRAAFVAQADHGVAKDAANALWIQRLRPDASVFFLDSWKDSEGLRLRTTSALHQAGYRERLHSANPDASICTQLRREGVDVYEGSWAQMPGVQKYDGIFLDLCSGSEVYVREQLETATLRSAPGCALAWTLTERDFNGEPLLLRVLSLGEFLQDLGWRPALQRVRASTLVHRSGKGQQVVTQLWEKS